MTVTMIFYISFPYMDRNAYRERRRNFLIEFIFKHIFPKLAF